MTKEITKAFILQQMEDKFGLRELEPEKFRFSEEVVPVYNIEQHLKVWESYHSTHSITATGGRLITTVPQGEKWALRAYTIVFMSGAFTVAGLYIYRAHHRDANDFSYLDLTAAQSTSYLRTMPNVVNLEPGDTLYVNIDGFTAVGDLLIHYDFMREIIR